MSSPDRLGRFTGGDGSLSPRGYEYAGPCPKCGKLVPYTWVPEGSPVDCLACRAVVVDPWAPVQPARPPARRSPTQAILEQLPRLAELGTCRECARSVWFWKTKNDKGEPTTYVFDERPTLVVGIQLDPKSTPDAPVVVGLERRKSFVLHALTCQIPRRDFRVDELKPTPR